MDARSGTTADVVLCNATVITMDGARPRAGLAAIRGDRILALGDRDDLGLFKGAGTRVIDCQGGTIIPGFNDAHCHPLALASNLLSLDCSPRTVSSIRDIQAQIRQRAEKTREGQWVRAAGYDEFYLHEKRPPTRWELDAASPRHPVMLVHRTGQNCVLNSLALRLTGISAKLEGSSLHLDRDRGEPDGLVSRVDEEVRSAIPSMSEEEAEEGMKLVNREYLSHGVTSLQDTSWTNGWRHWRVWRRLIERGYVSPRVSLFLGAQSLDEHREAGLSMGSGDDRLRVAGVKLALDESTGCPHPPLEDIKDLALRAHKAGFRIAFHVSDVPNLRDSLVAIQSIWRQAPRADHRFRLEHCAICPPDLWLRLKASHAVVVTQPSFLYFMGDKYQTDYLYPLASLKRRGVGLALSSDSPLVPTNPLFGIYTAVTRRTESGQRFDPGEGVSAAEALEMYTLGGAYASSEEDVKGSITPGKLADLAVLNSDPTTHAPERLLELGVALTIVGGRIAWEG
ncbi:MAG: amidohydrolase [Chloroflexi bacterium]|nr:amidohydrolase [Chloroflexota bacterium]